MSPSACVSDLHSDLHPQLLSRLQPVLKQLARAMPAGENDAGRGGIGTTGIHSSETAETAETSSRAKSASAGEPIGTNKSTGTNEPTGTYEIEADTAGTNEIDNTLEIDNTREIDGLDAAVILGSGLGGFSESIQNRVEIPYEELPGFPVSTVPGHSGRLIFGRVANKTTMAFSGRFHRYEGYDLSQTVLPVRLACALGAKQIIISNAAGAINTKFEVGDLVLLHDLFRFFERVSPKPATPFRIDLLPAVRHAEQVATSIGLPVRRGTYLFAKGPTYETKAEVEAFRRVGADMVGMSTVPEILEATRLGLSVTAVSLITNMAAGVQKGKLHHDEVKVAAESRKTDFARFVTALIEAGSYIATGSQP